MHRFLCREFKSGDSLIHLKDPQEIHHLRNVLRLKIGDPVEIFNGQNLLAQTVIQRMKKTSIALLVQEEKRELKSRGYVTLACAIPKKTKFETIIEKCTELGIDEIIPVLTERTEFPADKIRRQKKHLRYQTVAINAAKQCQRSTLPVITPITAFKDALNNIQPNDLALIACLAPPHEPLYKILSQRNLHKHRVIYFIGPEGDFTPTEVELAKEKGCQPVSLGKTVLKVDTAALSVMAMINFLMADEQ